MRGASMDANNAGLSISMRISYLYSVSVSPCPLFFAFSLSVCMRIRAVPSVGRLADYCTVYPGS